MIRNFLTPAQYNVLFTLGVDIGNAWIQAAGADISWVDPAYDFSGDWTDVRAAARICGVDWAPDAWQPAAEVQAAVWSAVEAGYKQALGEAGL